ncbi:MULTISPECIES: FadR/GntR family transcriptional regulator [Rhizobium/Agrobacterium group]|uniref:FadR/GntR family transcriptional regulator n=1 Tax=Rhizobium/Agrobacterium group TaxID=227290 RepID=UPI001ADB43ED|nr:MULTISPECIES: FadR/GntR family transcriptional regulator [Rhizobium/Agrobacterium group]MBO9112626.1 FadR family transcriptional regulator [Agrobacterium sp. S2/73]QXZ76126.1 FadR family transcriptional regulator [Agrobacterium sp. S7/73]QYA16870.1 FadR family transcriptional regulator [Rhizobium sp. AB2/73]UEQ85558.1 FadR family transcriptional regulator [Rhizobium sp. AB2/73]
MTTEKENEVQVTRAGGRGGDYERVLGFLRDQLSTGKLKVGDRLLSERDLAAQMGVSRPLIREALRALAALGAVDIRHGQGTVVRQPDLSIFGEFFSFILAQQAEAIDDVMQARIAIELQAVRLACRRATAVDFDRCGDAMLEIVATISNPEEGGAADFKFHEMLVRAAHSPTLLSLYIATSNLLRQSHVTRRTQILNVEGIQSFLIDHHQQIYQALLRRDEAKAVELLQAHFDIGAAFRRRAKFGDLALAVNP